MKIHSLMSNTSTDNTLFTEDFVKVMTDFRSYFKTKSDNKFVTVSPNLAHKYAGDFYGLLNYLKVNAVLHHIVLLLNNLDSPQDYNGFNVIFLPIEDEVIKVKNLYINSKTYNVKTKSSK